MYFSGSIVYIYAHTHIYIYIYVHRLFHAYTYVFVFMYNVKEPSKPFAPTPQISLSGLVQFRSCAQKERLHQVRIEVDSTYSSFDKLLLLKASNSSPKTSSLYRNKKKQPFETPSAVRPHTTERTPLFTLRKRKEQTYTLD